MGRPRLIKRRKEINLGPMGWFFIHLIAFHVLGAGVNSISKHREAICFEELTLTLAQDVERTEPWPNLDPRFLNKIKKNGIVGNSRLGKARAQDRSVPWSHTSAVLDTNSGRMEIRIVSPELCRELTKCDMNPLLSLARVLLIRRPRTLALGSRLNGFIRTHFNLVRHGKVDGRGNYH